MISVPRWLGGRLIERVSDNLADPPARARTTGTRSNTPHGRGGNRWTSHLGSLAFLVPGGIWLLIIVVYSVVATIRDSFFNATSTQFVGLGNYRAIFSTVDILIAFRNNVIWVVIFPFLVTFLGLLFAVLSERVKWSTAFKTIMFMPIVFSMTASAMVWRASMDVNPNVGMINSALETAAAWFNPPGAYAVNGSVGLNVQQLAATNVKTGPAGSLESTTSVTPGSAVRLGLIGISPGTLSLLGAKTATPPSVTPHAVEGLVWRDFSPTHPTQQGTVFPDEVGIPDLRLSLIATDGRTIATTSTTATGDFAFSGIANGSYLVRVNSSNFNSGFTGINWLGASSLTPTNSAGQTTQALLSVPMVDISMIIAYLWIWAGFAMVVVGAGLAALNREVLEAARIDGASEWQTLRQVTIPMLSPVLVVVFVTMVINVLKIFDIIVTMPGAAQGVANTLASEMYYVGFTGTPQPGIASAIAVVLFLLVVPAMILNLRRIRG